MGQPDSCQAPSRIGFSLDLWDEEPKLPTAGSQKTPAMLFLFSPALEGGAPPEHPAHPILLYHGWHRSYSMEWSGTAVNLELRDVLVYLCPSPVPCLAERTYSKRLLTRTAPQSAGLSISAATDSQACKGPALPAGSRLPHAETAELSSRSATKPDSFRSRAMDRPN